MTNKNKNKTEHIPDTSGHIPLNSSGLILLNEFAGAAKWFRLIELRSQHKQVTVCATGVFIPLTLDSHQQDSIFGDHIDADPMLEFWTQNNTDKNCKKVIADLLHVLDLTDKLELSKKDDRPLRWGKQWLPVTIKKDFWLTMCGELSLVGKSAILTYE